MSLRRFSLPVTTLFFLLVLLILSCSTPESLFFGTVLPHTIHTADNLRIVALGDAGTGGLLGGGKQQLVADDLALRANPAGSSPVDFVLYLGDNFYEEGVSSVSDPLWNTAFADVYDFSRLPLFYVIAGNHDYLEIRQAVDGVHHVVSGAGGKLRAVTAETESHYAVSVPGAVIIELDASGVTLIPRESDTGTDGTPVTWIWD